jgi:hypothetical protein
MNRAAEIGQGNEGQGMGTETSNQQRPTSNIQCRKKCEGRGQGNDWQRNGDGKSKKAVGQTLSLFQTRECSGANEVEDRTTQFEDMTQGKRIGDSSRRHLPSLDLR